MHSYVLGIHIEPYCSCIFDLPLWAFSPFNKIALKKSDLCLQAGQISSEQQKGWFNFPGFSVMTWAGVLVVSLFNPDLACAAASKICQDYARGHKAKWLWRDFPISAIHTHLYFLTWNIWFHWCLWFSRKADSEKVNYLFAFPTDLYVWAVSSL